jgi:formate hydrogenlyase subunit 4
MTPTAAAAFLAVLLLAPGVAGVATRTKSFLTGRRGAPVMQLYSDLWKLARRGVVYSDTTSGAFQLAPVVALATVLLAAALVPFDGRSSLLRFAGDAVAFAGVLALGRFALVLGALDTGSSFEGMGASREVMIATLVEGALFLVFAVAVVVTGESSMSAMFGAPLAGRWTTVVPSLAMVAVSLFAVTLAECARVPVDDPATHLELTMIHEVAVLDHSGPDLALLLYAGAVKLSLFAALVVAVLVPRLALAPVPSTVALAGGLVVVGVAVGVVESVTARLRMPKIPLYLAGSAAFALIGLALLLR